MRAGARNVVIFPYKMLAASAYKSDAVAFQANFPMPQQSDDPQHLTEPVLLLGTASTGKITALQAANALLGADGLASCIVRCAYTAMALGMGGRTLVSLFRLSRPECLCWKLMKSPSLKSWRLPTCTPDCSNGAWRFLP